MPSISLNKSRPRVSPADLIARYGGQEFAVILSNTDLSGAKEVVKKGQHSIRELKLPHNSSKTSQFVRISIGISSQILHQDQPVEDLIRTMDRALYATKA